MTQGACMWCDASYGQRLLGNVPPPPQSNHMVSWHAHPPACLKPLCKPQSSEKQQREIFHPFACHVPCFPMFSNLIPPQLAGRVQTLLPSSSASLVPTGARSRQTLPRPPSSSHISQLAQKVVTYHFLTNRTQFWLFL